jgi:hypothetical protein
MTNFFKKIFGFNDEKPERDFYNNFRLERKPCKKDSSKICPIKDTISCNGHIKTTGLGGCCEIQESVERMYSNIAKLEPGKNYNGTVFTKELIESCKRHTGEKDEK